MTHHCPEYVATEHVYVMVWGNLVKIGVTADPERRRAQVARLQGPPSIELVATATGGRDTEHLLHVAFSDQHEHGEWYRLEGSLLALVEHYRKHMIERETAPTLPTDGRVLPSQV